MMTGNSKSDVARYRHTIQLGFRETKEQPTTVKDQFGVENVQTLKPKSEILCPLNRIFLSP